MQIVVDDLTHKAVIALLEFHLRAAFENPPGSVFALDLDGLRDPARHLVVGMQASFNRCRPFAGYVDESFSACFRRAL